MGMGVGGGCCAPVDRLAIQKKKWLYGAGRIIASRGDDFFRSESRNCHHIVRRCDDLFSLSLSISLCSILPRENVERGKRKDCIISRDDLEVRFDVSLCLIEVAL